jgi:hypothetical protein
MTIDLTAEQAAAIGKVLQTAHDDCESCARNLAAEMAAICPGHDWLALVGQEHDEDPPFDIGAIAGGRVAYDSAMDVDFNSDDGGDQVTASFTQKPPRVMSPRNGGRG